MRRTGKEKKMKRKSGGLEKKGSMVSSVKRKGFIFAKMATLEGKTAEKKGRRQDESENQ